MLRASDGPPTLRCTAEHRLASRRPTPAAPRSQPQADAGFARVDALSPLARKFAASDDKEAAVKAAESVEVPGEGIRCQSTSICCWLPVVRWPAEGWEGCGSFARLVGALQPVFTVHALTVCQLLALPCPLTVAVEEKASAALRAWSVLCSLHCTWSLDAD